MIIRTLSSKWGVGSDLSFVLRMSFRQKQSEERHLGWMPPLSFIIISAVFPSTPWTPSALLRSQRIFVSQGAGLSLRPPPRGTGCRFHSRLASFSPFAILRNQFTKDAFPSCSRLYFDYEQASSPLSFNTKTAGCPAVFYVAIIDDFPGAVKSNGTRTCQYLHAGIQISFHLKM